MVKDHGRSLATATSVSPTPRENVGDRRSRREGAGRNKAREESVSTSEASQIRKKPDRKPNLQPKEEPKMPAKGASKTPSKSQQKGEPASTGVPKVKPKIIMKLAKEPGEFTEKWSERTLFITKYLRCQCYKHVARPETHLTRKTVCFSSNCRKLINCNVSMERMVHPSPKSSIIECWLGFFYPVFSFAKILPRKKRRLGARIKSVANFVLVPDDTIL